MKAALIVLLSLFASVSYATDLPDSVTPYMLLQAQVIGYAGDGASLANADRGTSPCVGPRRMRGGVRGTTGNIRYHVMADLSRTDMLYEAWLRWEPTSSVSLLVGNHMIQFGRSQVFYPAELALAEFPYATRALSPFRQPGLQASGAIPGGLRWYVSGFMAPQRAGTFWQGYREDAGTGASKPDGLGGAVRVQYEPFGAVGDVTAHDGAHGSFRVNFAADYMHLDGTQYRTDAYSASLHAKAYGFHLLAELLRNMSNHTSQAAYIETGYYLSLLNAAVRYEFAQPDVNDASQTQSIYSVAVGVNPHRHIRTRIQTDVRQVTSGTYAVVFAVITLAL